MFDVKPVVFVYASTLNEIYGTQNITIFDLINKVTDVFFADNIANKNLFYFNIDKLFNNTPNLDNINIDFIRDNLDIHIKYQLENIIL